MAGVGDYEGVVAVEQWGWIVHVVTSPVWAGNLPAVVVCVLFRSLCGYGLAILQLDAEVRGKPFHVFLLEDTAICHAYLGLFD
jgi:hypothetical protein